ncbi:ACP S-malonyltransferase [Pseudomonadota bacterium]|nr:ACP S-malonyltransferase [Pseudomonadota bacterium]
MNFIVFPGQGSQKIGMGKELSENFVEAKNVFEEVNDAINFNLTKIMWEGSDAEISLTSNAQPALMACSVAVFRVLQKLTSKKLPDLADYICGHSLGEYTAMTIAEVFSLEECSVLLRLRGNAMQEAVPIGKGAMAAFIGVDIDTTQKILDNVQIHGICDIGNDNADGQVVISGDKLAVEKAMEISKNFGVKRAVILPVSAPFHCRLMLPAQEIMKEALEKINFYSPLIPIVSNTTAEDENDPDKLKKNLIDQVTGTVRWRETMHFVNSLNTNRIIELGSGKILTGIAKRMLKNVTAFNIEKPSDFDQF